MRISSQLTAGLSFGFLALAGLAGPAAASDMSYGSGLVRHRVPAAAVPVPAPAPAPDGRSSYYVRVDGTYGMGTSSKYTTGDARADSVRGDSGLDNYNRLGLGAGYYFNRWLRADVTLDIRSDVRSTGNGSVNYSVANPTNPVNTTMAMRDTFTDGFTSTNTTGLINAYVDLPVSQVFTPYFGAGIGFVRHQLRGRVFSKTTTCVDANDCDLVTAGDQGGGPTVIFTGTTRNGGTDYALAAAAMVGMTYKFSENGKLDLGYRFLHLAGTSYASRAGTSNLVSNLTIPDLNSHELRVGLRYDLN